MTGPADPREDQAHAAACEFLASALPDGAEVLPLPREVLKLIDAGAGDDEIRAFLDAVAAHARAERQILDGLEADG